VLQSRLFPASHEVKIISIAKVINSEARLIPTQSTEHYKESVSEEWSYIRGLRFEVGLRQRK